MCYVSTLFAQRVLNVLFTVFEEIFSNFFPLIQAFYHMTGILQPDSTTQDKENVTAIPASAVVLSPGGFSLDVH